LHRYDLATGRVRVLTENAFGLNRVQCAPDGRIYSLLPRTSSPTTQRVPVDLVRW
jgi:hypothetical protein